MSAAHERASDDADALRQFEDALRARGIIPPRHILAGGKLHRCDAVGRGGKNDASYLLHLDGDVPAGGFQNWRDGLGWEDWRADIGRSLTAAERQELRQKAEIARAEREAEEARRHAEAADRAAIIWRDIPLCVEHPYLDRKGVRAHGVRASRGKIVIPIRDAEGLLHSLQFIDENGGKKYLAGGRVAGCYFAIGKPADVILIGEGYATCASAHEATGHPVAVAFDCGNLRAVAEAVRAKFETARIVLLADDDYLTIGNPGIAKAKESAAVIGGVIAVPEFGPTRPDGFKDFNDMAKFAGAEAVKGVIEAALAVKPEPSAERARDDIWADPDLGVLRLNRRPAPPLPLAVFGQRWGEWIAANAEAAACPPDYVAAPLLTAAATLIGNARWAQATPGWAEPPHLWIGSVGDSGTGKSPGSDALMRGVLPAIERKMAEDFPDRLREWRAAAEMQQARHDAWKSEVRAAAKAGKAPPRPPLAQQLAEPQQPRLRQNDTTIEKIADLLGAAAPKGLLLVRDELAGWIMGMNSYHDAGRAFWVEAYGGRPFRVERKMHPEPIVVPRLVVSVYGGTQPDRLAALMRDGDDGLLARILWAWPNPVQFRLGQRPTEIPWAIDALDRLRELDLSRDGDEPAPVFVPLASDARPLMEQFGQEMQSRQTDAGGLMTSALGKARGQALRLALVLEFLWWCAEDGMAPPPNAITVKAFVAAARLLDDYFVPMAERLYGDAAIPAVDRDAATLARWIRAKRPAEVYVRHLQREVRLPGLNTADKIHAAAGALVEADWLLPPPPVTEFGRKRREAYAINPRLWEALK